MKAFLKSLLISIWETLRGLLNATYFQSLIEDWLLNLLKSQLMGGFKGWLIKLLVREFSEDVIEVANDTLDHIEIIKKAKGTINETDRDVATTDLNDIMSGKLR